jgi:hypothetical protein
MFHVIVTLSSVVGTMRLPLWSSGQSSWLQIQRSGFDSRCYQIFWEIVGLERGPLSLVSTTEELRGGKKSDSGLEIREYGQRDLSCWPHGTLHPLNFSLTSPTSSGHLVSIVRSRTQATEFVGTMKGTYCHCLQAKIIWSSRNRVGGYKLEIVMYTCYIVDFEVILFLMIGHSTLMTMMWYFKMMLL